MSCGQLGGDHKLPGGGWVRVMRVGSVFSEQDLRGGLDFTVTDMGWGWTIFSSDLLDYSDFYNRLKSGPHLNST